MKLSRILVVSVFICLFLVFSTVVFTHAEEYRNKTFPSNEVLTKKINTWLQKKAPGMKLDKVIGKNGSDGKYTVYFNIIEPSGIKYLEYLDIEMIDSELWLIDIKGDSDFSILEK
jgi:hypothetical protein